MDFTSLAFSFGRVDLSEPFQGTGYSKMTLSMYGGAGGGSLSLGINNFTSISTLDYDSDGRVYIQLLSGAPTEIQTPSIQLSACGNNGANGPSVSQCNAVYNVTDPYGMFKSVDNRGVQHIKVSLCAIFRKCVCVCVCSFVC